MGTKMFGISPIKSENTEMANLETAAKGGLCDIHSGRHFRRYMSPYLDLWMKERGPTNYRKHAEKLLTFKKLRLCMDIAPLCVSCFNTCL